MNQTENRQERGESFDLDDILKEYGSAPASPGADIYRIPDPQPAERRSSLPTEDEVRAYLASYARGEAEPSYQPRRTAGPVFPEPDERFLTGENRASRRRLRYGEATVDTGPDANYRPPRSESAIVTNVAEPDDDEIPDDPVKPKLFQRLKEKYEAQRTENAKKEAQKRAEAEKISFPEPEELILPGEKPAQTPPRQTHRAPPEAAVSEAESDAAQPESSPAAEAGKSAFTPSWSRRAGEWREYASMFPDTSASPAIYADQKEEAYKPDETDASIPLKKDKFFPANFREYLTSILTTAFYGLRKGAETILTAEEDDEDLGAEATPAYASRYYGRFIRTLRLRLRLSLVLLFVLAWISLGLPTAGQLANIRVAAWFCLAIQLTVMLLCQDVLTGGVLNACRKRIGADSLAVLACLVTSLDALLVGTGKLTAPHMPFCLVSSASLIGILFSSLLSARGLRKTLRVPAIAKRAYTVTGEMAVKNRGTTILKSQRSYAGFVRRSEEAPPDETFFQKISIPLLFLVLLLTLVTLIVTGDGKDFLFILSVLLCAAVPFGALLCFALPFCTGAFRIFPSGAAIAGWSGLCDIGQSRNLIVTDRDLFPDGTVDIDQVRIFADASPERIISYAGSMLTASGSCVSHCFAELMERHHCAMRQIEDFAYLPGGGMRGVIDSSVILCGSSDLMQLMNVRIPFRLINQTSILLAVDGVLYGIFNMKYTADPQVRRALLGLMRSSRHPIFAIRDFNVTPVMLHDCFDVATDGYDFPPYVDRFAISSTAPGEDSKVAAVVCRDGLGPLSNMANTGRSMYVSVRTSLYFTALSALFGVVFCFIRMLSAGNVSVLFLFLLMLLFLLPVLFLGLTLKIE